MTIRAAAHSIERNRARIIDAPIGESLNRRRDLVTSVVIAGGVFFIADLMDLVLLSRGPASILLLSVGAVLYFLISRFGSPRWFKLALLLGSVSVAICLVELVFRVFLLRSYVPADAAEFHSKISSSWPRPILEGQSEMFRIVGLADSFGRAGENRNYHFLIEERFAERGFPLEVVNLSHPAYDLPDELLLLQRFGDRFAPDVVLHGFFVGNDFSMPHGQFMDYAGIQVRARSGRAAFRPISFALGDWIPRLANVTLERFRKRADSAGGTFSEATFLGIEKKRLQACRRGRETDWTRIVGWLDGIREEAERIGARYAMVVHPDQFQVESGLRKTIFDRFGMNPADYDFDLPQRFLRDYCEQTAIPCLDLLPTFRSHGQQGGLYETHDTHYNDRGNQLAATTIMGFLDDSGLAVRRADLRSAR
jgi:hypothetical protein